MRGEYILRYGTFRTYFGHLSDISDIWTKVRIGSQMAQLAHSGI